MFSFHYKFINEIGKNDSFDFTYSNLLYYTDVNSKKIGYERKKQKTK